MITGYILGDRELVRRLEVMPARAKARLDATVRALGFELENRVKSAYLRGPRPQRLGVRTGRLLSSITAGGPQSRSRFESTPTSAMYYVGTNVEYGALWEYGFRRKVGAGARGGPRSLSGAAYARYFAQHPPGVKDVGARAFLAPALHDLKAHIVERIQAALRDSMIEATKK